MGGEGYSRTIKGPRWKSIANRQLARLGRSAGSPPAHAENEQDDRCCPCGPVGLRHGPAAVRRSARIRRTARIRWAERFPGLREPGQRHRCRNRLRSGRSWRSVRSRSWRRQRTERRNRHRFRPGIGSEHFVRSVGLRNRPGLGLRQVNEPLDAINSGPIRIR